VAEKKLVDTRGVGINKQNIKATLNVKPEGVIEWRRKNW